MKRFVIVGIVGSLALGAGAGRAEDAPKASTSAAPTAGRDLASEVRASERAFAKTMADRNLASFGDYVAEEGVFFGGKGPLRGRAAVVAAWTRFFQDKEAPFSWEPEMVEVLPSGTLALTSGPVHDPKGALIGTFNSIWRLEPDGRWRVVFDRGCEVCAPEKKQ
jgi:ketosteroid isomerase-like protein